MNSVFHKVNKEEVPGKLHLRFSITIIIVYWISEGMVFRYSYSCIEFRTRLESSWVVILIIVTLVDIIYNDKIQIFPDYLLVKTIQDIGTRHCGS